MSNIIDKIQVSGITYDIGGGGGIPESAFTAYTASTDIRISQDEEVTAAGLNALNDRITPTVELTQAQYDALVDKDPNTYYIITDAQAGDLTNYYTKSETNTLLGGKQDTLVSSSNIKTINNESILGSGNINIKGGSTYTAGRGIDITNDTVSFDLPISATTLGLECFNSVSNSKTGDSSTFNNVVVGSYNTIGGNGQRREFRDNFIWGNNNKIIDNNWQYDKSSTVNIICGYGNIITGESNSYTSIFGYYNNSYKSNQTLFGYYNKSINQYETSFGRYNNSVSASATFGDSGNTLFSVGNGTSTSARHNAFEIRQNGDIYLSLNGQDVKLQDQLGGSSITVDTALDSGSTNPVENRVIYNKIDEVEQVTAAALNELNDAVSGKQDTLVSGTNIKTINNESILGSGNIDIQGGSDINVVQTTGTSTTDVMSQNAATTQLNGTVKLSNVGTYFISSLNNYTNSLGIVFHRFDNDNTSSGSRIWYGKINGKYTCGFGNPAPSDLMNLSVVETSAITTAITSSSTDAQVPSAKAVNDALGGLKLVKLSQAEYNALATKDSSTLYVIVD